jgi:hypothetical protein
MRIMFFVSHCMSHLSSPVDGYNAAAPLPEKLSSMQLMAYALQFEIGDYAAATQVAVFLKLLICLRLLIFGFCCFPKANRNHPVWKTTHGQRHFSFMGEHCSSLVKVTPSDLLGSHVTWSAFNTMLRTFKHYDLPTGRLSFSSFPGLPFSGDDWFINQHQLLIMETTNEIFNMSLYQFLTPQTVPYWIRVQVANTAKTGPEWHNTFKQYNNGGYEEEDMCVLNVRVNLFVCLFLHTDTTTNGSLSTTSCIKRVTHWWQTL